MAGYDNIKDHGFEKRTADERRELAVAAGKKSGEARRRKADFRKTLNALLTAEIDSPEWEPILKELGVDCTLESALNMAMIKQGLKGNVKALAEAIMQTWESYTTVTTITQNAKVRARQTHNADENYGRLLEIYTVISNGNEMGYY